LRFFDLLDVLSKHAFVGLGSRALPGRRFRLFATNRREKCGLEVVRNAG
jgi:hypothetical protein